MEHGKSNSKSYGMNDSNIRNYKSNKSKDYYKSGQYSSNHRNNINHINSMYTKSNSGLKEDKEYKYKNEEKRKFGINISRDKESERYKDKEYKEYKEYEYNKDNKYEDKNSNNSNNNNKSKIVIHLSEEKKDNKERIRNS